MPDTVPGAGNSEPNRQNKKKDKTKSILHGKQILSKVKKLYSMLS